MIISKEKALESDRLKSAFLINMSHEIRAPMNIILRSINLLNEPDLSKAIIVEYTTVINRGGKRLLTKINDIIDIPKDSIQAIFEQLEQAVIRDTRALEGSGLGLAISKAYIEMLGGKTFPESEDGTGSKFIFTIPISEN